MRFKEDGLFEKVFPLLKKQHRISKKCRVERHKFLRGFEIDVYITWKSRYDYEYGMDLQGNIKRKTVYYPKSMIVELKQTDLPKLIEQVLKRRILALYTYAVINLPPRKVLRWLGQHPDMFQKILDNDIGLISIEDEQPILLLESHGDISTLLFNFYRSPTW